MQVLKKILQFRQPFLSKSTLINKTLVPHFTRLSIINRHYASDSKFNSNLTSGFDQSYIFNSGQGRSLTDIKYRTVCLQLFLARWGIEAAIKNGASGDRIESADRGIQNAISACELKEKFSNKEFQYLIKPLGTWSDMELNENSWSWEDFGMLQWTLGIIDKLPEINSNFSKGNLFQNTMIQPNQPESILNFLNQIKFNPQEDDTITDSLAKMELWHWRSQSQMLLNLKKLKSEIFNEEVTEDDSLEITDFSQLPVGLRKMINDLPKAIEQTTNLAFEKGLLVEKIDNDFGIIDKEGILTSFGKLNEEATDEILKISETRLHTLTYLMGNLEWDDTVSRLGDDDRGLNNLPNVWKPEEN
ncbi:hypothetical protein K502DRAFT_365716 [Neoconidiobolus thromboides FSU 785]|nr:hypothetical protein K502DRAFT_365716 [Neoconidiobolus thromboides FSU 785]